MVQEEVAQKLTKSSGRGYGFITLYFQHFFEWQLLDKISPNDFYPAPKVFSRLLYFKPHKQVREIPDEQNFWKFIKACFHQPRRTLRNSLSSYAYAAHTIPETVLKLRSQQMTMDDFMLIWENIRQQSTP